MITNKKRTGALVLGTLAIAGALGFFLFQRTAQPVESIVPYDAVRDQAALLRIFDENAYWLDTRLDLPLDQQLFTEARASFLQHLTEDAVIPEADRIPYTLRFMVYRYEGETVGFVAYRFLTSSRGQLLLIAVNEKIRKHGIARKLLRFAIEQMRLHGVQSIELLTRTDNIPAQKLYRSAGFKELQKDTRFVTFELLF